METASEQGGKWKASDPTSHPSEQTTARFKQLAFRCSGPHLTLDVCIPKTKIFNGGGINSFQNLNRIKYLKSVQLSIKGSTVRPFQLHL